MKNARQTNHNRIQVSEATPLKIAVKLIDGSSGGSADTGGSGMVNAIIGAGNGFGAITGRIAEVICYDSALSGADRQRVELYLNTEAQGTGYGIY